MPPFERLTSPICQVAQGRHLYFIGLKEKWALKEATAAVLCLEPTFSHVQQQSPLCSRHFPISTRIASLHGPFFLVTGAGTEKFTKLIK